MIPKYCYYRPASDTRSDKFIIERHPKLIADASKHLNDFKQNALYEVASAVEKERTQYLKKYELVNPYD